VPAAVAHLRAVDPRLGALIDRVGPERLGDLRRGRPSDPLAVLQATIIGQQVSVAAARAIVARLNARFGGRAPSAPELLADDPDALRVTVGLTRGKTAALVSLAHHAADGSLGLDRLDDLSDGEVTERLLAVRGLGPWSAEIFLILGLGRRDVVAAGDLGIRRAIRNAYGLAVMPASEEVRSIARAWRPERSLACLFLWRSLELGVSTPGSPETA
jgi:DNA-3-methyladenine glycosylase II